MSKNKGQNNANDMKSPEMSGDMSNRSATQSQNKSNLKKGSTNKTKSSGAQG